MIAMCSFQLFFIISFDFIFCIVDLTAVKEIVNKVKKIFEMDTRLVLCSEGGRGIIYGEGIKQGVIRRGKELWGIDKRGTNYKE